MRLSIIIIGFFLLFSCSKSQIYSSSNKNSDKAKFSLSVDQDTKIKINN